MSRQLWTLYDVACPYCGAGFAQPCRTAKGKPIGDTFHVKRRIAFRNARAARSSGR